jgi:predicted Zn-dependent peptidase
MEDNASRAGWLARWTPLLDDDQPLPDYLALIDAVTSADLSRVVETYFTPQRSYVARHDPAITVTGSARALGVVAALGAGAWLGKKLWRKA